MQFAWTAAGVIVPLLIGLAASIVMGGPTEGEASVARLLFSASAVILGGVAIWWSLTTQRPIWWRLVVGASVGTLAISITPEALRWVSLRQQQAAMHQSIVSYGPLIDSARRAQWQCDNEMLRQILAKWDQLNRATSFWEHLTGRENPQQRLAVNEHMRNELAALLENVQTVAMSNGDALILKTGHNTFRLTFPVPMRIPPNITFRNVPAGATANIMEKSTLGFTVVFTPPAVNVDHLPALVASADF